MIRGQVVGFQAQVSVIIRLPNRPDIEIVFVVDTGFEGALALPPDAIAALGLPYFTEIDANLANGSNVKADVHIATIVWNGMEMDVTVLAMGQRPLLGSVLLAYKHLGVDFEEGGSVVIEDLP